MARGESYMSVSRFLNVPKSTLNRWRHNPGMVLGSGNTTVLTQGEEALLVCAFNFMADAGLPLGRNQLVSIFNVIELMPRFI